MSSSTLQECGSVALWRLAAFTHIDPVQDVDPAKFNLPNKKKLNMVGGSHEIAAKFDRSGEYTNLFPLTLLLSLLLLSFTSFLLPLILFSNYHILSSYLFSLTFSSFSVSLYPLPSYPLLSFLSLLASSAGYSFSEDGTQVTSTDGGNNYSLLDVGFVSGEAVVEFSPVNDTSGDECR